MTIWNAVRNARAARAVSAYNAAIDNAAKASGSYEGLPLKLNLGDIRDMVGEDKAAYRRIVGNESDRKTTTKLGLPKKARPSMLDRATLPGAMTINEETGLSRYVEQENKYLYRRAVSESRKQRELYEADIRKPGISTGVVNRGAEKVSDTILSGKPFDEMNAAEKAIAEVNIGTPVPSREAFRSAEDLKYQSMGAAHAKLDAQVVKYLAVWTSFQNMHHELEGYQRLIDIALELKANYPDALRKLFMSGIDEIQPSFIYLNTKNAAYRAIPFEQRHSRAVRAFENLYDSVVVA